MGSKRKPSSSSESAMANAGKSQTEQPDLVAAETEMSYAQPQGDGGETHQTANDAVETLTTQQGIPVSDDQNSLRIGARGPSLLEDFHFREKIFHFDHERIPERVVHARGFGAHGYFETYESLADITRADLFQRAGEKTPAFVRFSTVAGNKGSADLARDVRGFAVKLYTKEGNWDIVGNNIPVFFIQDAIKFPDLIHAVEAGAGSRLPAGAVGARQLLGLHLADARKHAHDHVGHVGPRHPALVPLHGRLRRPHLPPRQRRGQVDLRQVPLEAEARAAVGGLERGGEDQRRRSRTSTAATCGTRSRPATSRNGSSACSSSTRTSPTSSTSTCSTRPRLIPEEDVRRCAASAAWCSTACVDNFFAETEQVAFCTQNIVPGIDFTNDPLLQGRNFSYLDTQLKRLGGPNFTHLPDQRAASARSRTFQQDGHMAMQQSRRAGSTTSPTRWGARRRSARRSRTRLPSFPDEVAGPKTSDVAAESFADHYSQARQFFISQTPIERNTSAMRSSSS